MFTAEQLQNFTHIFKQLEAVSDEACGLPWARDYHGGKLVDDFMGCRERAFKAQMLSDWNRSASTTYYVGEQNTVMVHGGKAFNTKEELDTFFKSHLLCSLSEKQQTQFLAKASEHLQQGGLLHHLGYSLAEKYNAEPLRHNKPDLYQFKSRCYLYPIENGIALVEEAKLYGHQRVQNGLFVDSKKFSEANTPVVIRQYSSLTLDRETGELTAKVLAHDYTLKDERYLASLEFNPYQYHCDKELELGQRSTPVVERVNSFVQKVSKRVLGRLSTQSQSPIESTPPGVSEYTVAITTLCKQLQEAKDSLSANYFQGKAKFERAHDTYKQAMLTLYRLRVMHDELIQAFSVLTECFNENNTKREEQLSASEESLKEFEKQLAQRVSTIYVRVENIKAKKTELEQRRQHLSTILGNLPQTIQEKLAKTKRSAERELSILTRALNEESNKHQEQLESLKTQNTKLQSLLVHLREQIEELKSKYTASVIECSAISDFKSSSIFTTLGEAESNLLQCSVNHLLIKLIHKKAKSLLTQSSQFTDCLSLCDEEALGAIQQEIDSHQHELDAVAHEAKRLFTREQELAVAGTSCSEDMHEQVSLYETIISRLNSRYQQINEGYQQADGCAAELISERQDLVIVPNIETFIKIPPTNNERVLLNEVERINKTVKIAGQKARASAHKRHDYVRLLADKNSPEEKVLYLLHNYYLPRGGVFGKWWHWNRHHHQRAMRLSLDLRVLDTLDKKRCRLEEEIVTCALDDTINHQGSYFRRLVVMQDILLEQQQPLAPAACHL